MKLKTKFVVKNKGAFLRLYFKKLSLTTKIIQHDIFAVNTQV